MDETGEKDKVAEEEVKTEKIGNPQSTDSLQLPESKDEIQTSSEIEKIHQSEALD